MSESSQGYRASLFRASLGNEVVEGTIFLDRWKLRFESDAVVEEIPSDRLKASWEESEGRIYFQDRDDPELNIYTLDQSILERPAMPQLVCLRNRVGQVTSRRETSRNWRLTGYFFLGCVIVAWLVSVTMSFMVRSIAARVPPEWEMKIGESAIDELRTNIAFGEFTNEVAQLRVIAEPLLQVVPTGKTKIKFFVVDDPEPNACALPGGFVVVNTGLLHFTERPEELQAVLAHELAHVTQKHLIRKVVSSSGPLLIFGLFFHGDNNLFSVVGEGAGFAVLQGFSKEFETEADEVGWQYLVAANIDPRGMIDSFKKLEIWEQEQGGGFEVPQAFNSHPQLKKRIARLEAKWKKLRKKDGFLVQTESMPFHEK